MKTGLTILIVILGLLVLGVLTGVVGIHYPRVIENQPLVNPIEISKVEGSVVTLADGRILEFEGDAPKGSWENFFASGRKIDIEENGADEVMVWANKPGWICGTPWATPIRIPLIADDVYRNRREVVGLGTFRESQKTAEASGGNGGERR